MTDVQGTAGRVLGGAALGVWSTAKTDVGGLKAQGPHPAGPLSVFSEHWPRHPSGNVWTLRKTLSSSVKRGGTVRAT